MKRYLVQIGKVNCSGVSTLTFRFSEGFSEDNACDDKPLHCVLCVGVCWCVLQEVGKLRRHVWWGGYEDCTPCLVRM